MSKTAFWLTTLALLLVLALVVVVNKTGFANSGEAVSTNSSSAAAQSETASAGPTSSPAAVIDAAAAAQISEDTYLLIKNDSKTRGVTYGSYVLSITPACYEATFYPDNQGVKEELNLPDPCEGLHSAQINLGSETGRKTLPIADSLNPAVRAIHLNGDGWTAIMVGGYMCVGVQLKGDEIGTEKKGQWYCDTLANYKKYNPDGLSILYTNVNWDNI